MKKDNAVYNRIDPDSEFSRAAAKWGGIIDSVNKRPGIFNTVVEAIACGRSVEKLLILDVELQSEDLELSEIRDLLALVGRLKKTGINIEKVLRNALEEQVAMVSGDLDESSVVEEAVAQ